jgi:hypothetical protein
LNLVSELPSHSKDQGMGSQLCLNPLLAFRIAASNQPNRFKTDAHLSSAATKSVGTLPRLADTVVARTDARCDRDFCSKIS